MEGTNSRLDRILTGLQQTLIQCDSEIGAITSQILVREESLNLLEADTESIKVQYRKYEETVKELQQKKDSVEGRVTNSKIEIKSLRAKIENLSKSKSDPEVQNLIDHHEAAIKHHEDIANVAQTELIHDREQQEEIKRAMENLLREMKKTPSNKIDTKKTNDEIEQLKDSQATLDDARLRIVTLVNTLDPHRTTTGASKILNECEQKKRKLDDAFARTPGSTPGNGKQSKRMRPATPNKATPQRMTRQQQQQQQQQQLQQPADILTMDVESRNPAPTLLAPFLPPTAAKLLLIVDGRFDSIEWYASTVKIPMSEDVANTLGGTWDTTLQTTNHHFFLQTYRPLFSSLTSSIVAPEYRVIVIDPTAQVHNPDTYCVPLVTTKNKSEAVQFLDLLGEIEDHYSFDAEAVWRLLSKDS
jgi:hypothetical protein